MAIIWNIIYAATAYNRRTPTQSYRNTLTTTYGVGNGFQRGGRKRDRGRLRKWSGGEIRRSRRDGCMEERGAEGEAKGKGNDGDGQRKITGDRST